jgi:hypothetical protein
MVPLRLAKLGEIAGRLGLSRRARAHFMHSKTVLAAATKIERWGALLQPAWSLISSNGLRELPVIPGVEKLVILVDNDNEGRDAAAICAARWSSAGRRVVKLMPKQVGADFNDLVMGTAA